MKIAFPLSVLAGLVSLTQARLNFATTVLEQEADMTNELGRKKKQETGWHKPVRVSFTVEHFKTFEEEGKEDFNKKLAMGAFNRAFEQVFEGMTSDWGFIDSLVAVPEPDEDPDTRIINYEDEHRALYPRPDLDQKLKPNRPPTPARTGRIIYHGTMAYAPDCRLCPNDFLTRGKSSGQGESFSNFLKDQAKWDEVAKVFCAELKGTGIENYAEIRNCAFHVGYLGENEVELLEPTTNALGSGDVVSGSINTIVTAHRVPSSAVLDVARLEKAFTVAYNNVFEDRGYVVEGIQLIRQITAPETAVGESMMVRLHGNEVAVQDEGVVDFLTAMFWIKVNWTCAECNANDMLPGVFLQNMPDISRHTILESYVCNNLREFADLADVSGCGIVFQAGK